MNKPTKPTNNQLNATMARSQTTYFHKQSKKNTKKNDEISKTEYDKEGKYHIYTKSHKGKSHIHKLNFIKQGEKKTK